MRPRHPVLVVVADDALRRLLGHALAELALPATVVRTWRDAVSSGLDDPPRLVLADLDDVGPAVRGLHALLRRGDGTLPPLLLLSGRPDAAGAVLRAGAVAGLSKPPKVGQLLDLVQRVLRRADAG
jgi:DNA-binding response OmpR family regulator